MEKNATGNTRHESTSSPPKPLPQPHLALIFPVVPPAVMRVVAVTHLQPFIQGRLVRSFIRSTRHRERPSPRYKG